MIEPEAGEVKMREVSNRHIAVDFTFSVRKSVSMHLALTHDVAVEKLVHEALREISIRFVNITGPGSMPRNDRCLAHSDFRKRSARRLLLAACLWLSFSG